MLSLLKECYPSLTEITVSNLNQVKLQSFFFREEIRNLDLKFLDANFHAVFSSPAAKTKEDETIFNNDSVKNK